MEIIYFMLVCILTYFLASILTGFFKEDVIAALGRIKKRVKNYFYPPPKLSGEEETQIYMEAAKFVHSKHSGGDSKHIAEGCGDGFAEYLDVSQQMLKDKINEKSN